MRGKGRTVRYPRIDHRITPAYAGKRPERTYRNGTSGDHPRLCGEKRFPEAKI